MARAEAGPPIWRDDLRVVQRRPACNLAIPSYCVATNPMTVDHRPPPAASRPHSLLAALCAALLLLLGVFAVSRQAHAWLHPNAGDVNHQCAVVLFDHGLTPTVIAVDPPAVVVRYAAAPAAPRSELFLPAPHYRLMPGRGPPAC